MWTVVSVSLVVLALTVPATAPVAGAAGNPNPRILPPQSRPYGLTYTQWAARWSQWIFSIPSDQNPLGDPDGRFCQVGQSGPVFFLGSNFGGTSVRSCTVPAGRSILFTPGGFIGLLHIDADTEDALSMGVDEGVDALSNISADVDGVPVRDLGSYRVLTLLFDIALPPDNVFGLTPGEQGAIIGGFFLLLAPPSPGEHIVHMHDEFPAPNGISDVTYNLTVAPRSGN